eukprot:CAMPEP_0170552520 /NCGR_PEP_ID=MMETSP0211-20121228/10400_1 /TAXON_ID=311385 /ORGANISM="Pseudokeronopsis sp., Strain OXSARD2" /LENGTH=53 /DNA_ID=CAMNT_0010860273 /DNA_START=297 /DNA_END=458 /DNA_ORIENTATION=+
MKVMEKEHVKLENNKKHLELFKINIHNTKETIIFMRDITAIIEKEKNKTKNQV